MTTVCGTESGFAQGKCLLDAAFTYAYGLCIDPLNPRTALYVGDRSSIRYCDLSTDTVSLIAGSQRPGSNDGFGSAAALNGVTDLLCSSDGERLFVVDEDNDLIRLVNTKSQLVSTVAGKTKTGTGTGTGRPLHSPRKFTFDRSPAVKPESVIFISTSAAILRFDVTTREMSTCKWNSNSESKRSDADRVQPRAIRSVPSGHLIVSDFSTHSIHVYDPRTGDHSRLAGSAVSVERSGQLDDASRFDRPCDIVVVDHEHSIIIADYGNCRIRHMTLPASLFVNT